MKKLIFLLLFAPAMAHAQQLVAEAPLDGVKADGFYSVDLPPRVTALSTRDMSNVRILDNDSVEVPYITIVEHPDYRNVEWKPFRMEKKRMDGCCTVITLFNDDRGNLDNFLLQVKNAEINKSARLRGSDDGKTWYALVEQLPLSFGQLRSADVVTEVFDFPLSNYVYYQLTINDSTTSPLNVIKALRTREDIIHGMFVEVPDVSIISKDSVEDHATWATIRFDTTQYIDRLEFDFDGPHLFKRRATIFRKEEYTVKKKKKTRLTELQSFDIMSGQARPVYIEAKEKELFVRVENDDNQPLTLNKVGAYQFRHSLVAWLESKHTYKIVMGDDSMQPPVYDLPYFRDSIPAHPAELEVGELKNIARQSQVSATYFTDRNIIWVAIIVVAALLGTMSVRMLREKRDS